MNDNYSWTYDENTKNITFGLKEGAKFATRVSWMTNAEYHRGSLSIDGRWEKSPRWEYISKGDLIKSALKNEGLCTFIMKEVPFHFHTITINHKKQTVTFKRENQYIKCRLNEQCYCDSLSDKTLLSMLSAFVHNPILFQYCAKLWSLGDRSDYKTIQMSRKRFIELGLESQMREALVLQENMGVSLKDQGAIGVSHFNDIFQEEITDLHF